MITLTFAPWVLPVAFMLLMLVFITGTFKFDNFLDGTGSISWGPAIFLSFMAWCLWGLFR
jgi:hypothetical protein